MEFWLCSRRLWYAGGVLHNGRYHREWLTIGVSNPSYLLRRLPVGQEQRLEV